MPKPPDEERVVQIVDGVARLYGGAVLEQHRGRGVYRALLERRLQFRRRQRRHAHPRQGRVETSGPILRRAGFTAYGQERSYRIAL